MLRRSIRLLVSVAAIALPMVTVSASPAAAAGGLRITADTSYDIRTEEGLVDVTSDITVTNITPDRQSGSRITQYYYYAFSLPIPIEAENVAAAGGGRDLTVTITDGEDGLYDIAEIRLRSRLYYGQTQTIQLSFDFVGALPRSEESGVRVNNAFVWFYAWAFGDADRATVRIFAPRGLDVDITERRMEASIAEDGRRMWVAEDIPDPDGWYVIVNGWAEGRLASSGVDVDGNFVSVRYWPGDAQWRDEVVDIVERALPALIDTVGLGWPVEDQLVIRETIAPNVFGFGGWYLVDDDDIEIGELVDRELVIHEISHAWFNDELFESRWITEGLAQTVAELVLFDTFAERTVPDFVAEGDAGHRRLNTWSFPSTSREVDEDTEAYAYNASWIVVGELIDEIGVDGLQEILAAASNDEIAYLGAGPAEEVGEADDWRRFLDLVEERAGAASGDDLFREYVVDTATEDILDGRAAARAAYRALVDAQPEWSPAILIRRAMSDWEFGEATSSIGDARDVLEAVTAVETLAATLDLETPGTIEPAYESVQWSFNGVLAAVAEQEGALRSIGSATEVVSADRDEATRRGLERLDPDAELVAARDAFAAGDLAGARFHAALAMEMLDDAPVVGRARIDADAMQRNVVVAIAGLMLVWRIGALALRRQRRLGAAGIPAGQLPDGPAYGPALPVYGPPDTGRLGHHASPGDRRLGDRRTATGD